ncbi:YgjV family protein [Paenarthrobacter nitroguajacolicus]|uniref:CBU_0592 family membrane protein n=1 Tax=Paenarthrobacter nitroguajacolicus TaxID=211146 RepID=UPI0028675FD8|nr:YgjV family protein [Paenarthrobacter nitroguajacolicus]MDR6638508.1 hypothetical protein [Paenarthrobacter nitroguajacolicus]
MELLWEMTGWAGAAAMLGSYLSVSMGWLKPGISFQTANLFGSCAFIINGTLHGAWPSVATNVAWFLISAVALHRLRTKQEAVVVDITERTSTNTGTLMIVQAPQPTTNCA